MDTSVLSEFLECSVCLETMDGTSKVLPCQHTFCKRCLEEIVESHKELTCPECRLRVTTKVEDLPPNILIARLIEGLKNARVSAPDVNKDAASLAPRQLQTSAPATDGRKSAANKEPEFPAPAPSPNSLSMNVIGIPTSDDGVAPKLETSPRHHPTAQRPCARALYSYLSAPLGQLSFKVGDMIWLIGRQEDWFYGELNGRRGMFPKRYVKVLVPLPPSQPLQGLPLPVVAASAPQCVALYDFADEAAADNGVGGSSGNAGGNNRDKCLKFKAGEIITVLRRVDANWALGKLNGNVGIFPLPFVQLNQFARALLKHSNASGPSSLAPAAVPPSSAAAVGNGLASNGTSNPQLHPAPVPTAPSSSSSSSSPSQNTQPASQIPVSIMNGGNVARSRTAVCQPSPTASSSSSPSPSPSAAAATAAALASLPDVLRQLDPLMARGVGHQSPPSVQGTSPPGQAQVNVAQPPNALAASVDPSPRPGQASPSAFAVCEAVFSYTPQKPDELDLVKGDLYRIIEACQDHWFRGTHLKTGRTGVFPGNYVRQSRLVVSPSSPFMPANANMSVQPGVVPGGAAASVGAAGAGPAPSPSASSSAASTPVKSHQSRGSALMKKFSTKRRSSASAASSSASPQQRLQNQPHAASTCSLDDTLSSVAEAGATSAAGADGFEDSFVPFQHGAQAASGLHSRSGSCPSQLINVTTYSPNASRLSPAPLSVKLPQRIFRSVSTTSGPARSASNGEPPANVQNRRAKTPPTGIVIERYRCVMAYPAASPQELNLACGDVVFVQRRSKTKPGDADQSSSSTSPSSDGWLKGRHATTGNVGYFPAMFVQKV